MELPTDGLEMLLRSIKSPESSYTDPATGEQLHNSGVLLLIEGQAPKLTKEVSVLFIYPE
jgi:hypothetical protein